MRTILPLILALLAGAATLPSVAAEDMQSTLQPAVATESTLDKQTTPAAFTTSLGNITLGEAMAIVVGGAIVGLAADRAFTGGIFTLLGTVAGAALGSEWYERGMWPF